MDVPRPIMISGEDADGSHQGLPRSAPDTSERAIERDAEVGDVQELRQTKLSCLGIFEEVDMTSASVAETVGHSTKTHPIVFVHAYFLTIATILGTGILAMPTRLAHAGFSPFFLVATAAIFIQFFVIIFMTELLQRTQVIMCRKQGPKARRAVQMTEIVQEVFEIGGDSDVLTEDEGETEGGMGGSHSILSAVGGHTADHREKVDGPGEDRQGILKENGVEPEDSCDEVTYVLPSPDLHSMGTYFLNKWLRFFFDFAVYFHFLTIIIAYSLAGPQSLGALVGVPYQWLILPWILVLSVVVIGGGHRIHGALSSLTLLKGSLLVVMIFVVGYVSTIIHTGIDNDWRELGEPFLMTTVAMGGAVNTIPVIYSRVQPNARDVRRFLMATISAVATCGFLLLSWCLFVLWIVKQISDDPNEVTLERAARNGEISTIPLAHIIEEKLPSLVWIVYLVEIFTFVSILVSWTTMSLGWKHYLDGQVLGHSQQVAAIFYKLMRLKTEPNPVFWSIVCKAMLYILSFGTVAVFSLTNPESFLLVLESVNSLALNTEAGLFIVLMFGVARFSRQDEIRTLVPLQAGPWIVYLRWAVSAYFLLAILYDLGQVVVVPIVSRLWH